MRLLALLLAGCTHYPPPPPEPVGQASRAYTTLPAYLSNPIAEHDLTAQERMQHMNQLLRDIDARAGELDGTPGQTAELRLKVRELQEVVPPTPAVLLPVERMTLVLDETAAVPPEDTRRRLWALTDLIRLRTQF